jgi:hypothetical protein
LSQLSLLLGTISIPLPAASVTISFAPPRGAGWHRGIKISPFLVPASPPLDRLFGHIASLHTPPADVQVVFPCTLFVAGQPLVQGRLRVLSVVYSEGRPAYRCQIEPAAEVLRQAIAGLGQLNTLALPLPDPLWDMPTILNSWQTIGSGTQVVFPLVDCGQVSVNKVDYQYTALRPAIPLRVYLRAMFAAAGYSLDALFFDTAFFRGLLVPHNEASASATDTSSLQSLPLSYGDTLPLAHCIPKGLSCLALLDAVIELFGLYVLPHAFDPARVQVLTHAEYLATQGEVANWEGLLTRGRIVDFATSLALPLADIRLSPASSAAYYPKMYRARWQSAYGAASVQSAMPGARSLRSLFAAFPLVAASGVDKPVTATFGGQPGVDELPLSLPVSLLQARLVSGVADWQVLDGTTVLDTIPGVYPYAGHLDHPFAPQSDLLFGSPAQLFFDPGPSFVYPANNVLTTFHPYLLPTATPAAQLEAMLPLDYLHVAGLHFERPIFALGQYWRVAQIDGFAPGRPSALARVTLIGA